MKQRSQYYRFGLVAQGQFGKVYCAISRSNGRMVALKILDSRRSPTAIFLRELSSVLALHHPNLVQLYGVEHVVGQDGGAQGRWTPPRAEGAPNGPGNGSSNPLQRHLILEYCEGGTLRQLLESVPRPRTVVLLQILLELLAGLSHAHDRGIVHCDLKPENILLSLTPEGWSPKLTDFGIAHNQSLPPLPRSAILGSSGPGSSGLGSSGLGSSGLGSPVFGSPAYMAPELFRGKISPAADLYAVGIILYEILLGDRPFRGTPSELQSAHQQQLPPLPPTLPQEQRSLLLRALAKQPEQRFGSAVALAEALGEVMRSLTPSPGQHPTPAPTSPRTVQTELVQTELAQTELAQTELARTELAQTELFEPVQLKLQQITAQPISTSIASSSLASALACPSSPGPGLPLIAIAPDQSWQAQVEPVSPSHSQGPLKQAANIAPAHQLRCLRRGTESPAQLLPPPLAASTAGSVLILDRRHGVVWSSSRSATQLILFNRRGGILAPIRVAVPITQVVRSHQPLHLLAIEAPGGPSASQMLLKISLRPLRLQRIPLAIAPVSLLSLSWGVALIDGQGQLLLLDHEGQSLAQAAIPLSWPTESAIASPPQVQLLPMNEQEVAIAQGHPTATEPVQIHRICLNDLELDLIF